MTRLVLFLAILVSFSPAQASIVINEVLPNPVGSTETDMEWVEIYNTGPDTVNVTGWAIEDAATIDDAAIRRAIPEDFNPTYGLDPVMLPGEFRVVQGLGQAYVNNSGDTIYLNSDRTGNLGSVVHATSYGTAPEGQCWANLPDALGRTLDDVSDGLTLPPDPVVFGRLCQRFRILLGKLLLAGVAEAAIHGSDVIQVDTVHWVIAGHADHQIGDKLAVFRPVNVGPQVDNLPVLVQHVH